MNRNRSRRIAITLCAAAGSLLAATFLPMAVANADGFEFTPDQGSLVEFPQGGVGICPVFCTETGTENWNAFDLTPGHVGSEPNSLVGTDIQTNILTYENDLFDVTANTHFGFDGVGNGSLIDFTDFGFGIKNEFVDTLFTPSTVQGIFDTLFINGVPPIPLLDLPL